MTGKGVGDQEVTEFLGGLPLFSHLKEDSLLSLARASRFVDRVGLLMCPRLLEYESDIAPISDHFHKSGIDALLLVPGNFTLDHILPMMADAVGLPTILWGIPTQQAWGALVAIHQTLYPFKELGLRYRYLAAELGDARAWDKALAFASGAALVRRLRGLRIGLMGWRAQGMSDTAFDELALRETFGVQVVNVGLTRYTRAIDAVPDADVSARWAALKPEFDTANITDEVTRYGVRT